MTDPYETPIDSFDTHIHPEDDLEVLEDFETPTYRKDDPNAIRPRNESGKGDYINEHTMSILMAMFKNWDGDAPKDIQFKEPWKSSRARYELAKATYDSLIAEGVDKRNQKVQTVFMEMLTLASTVYPNNQEIAELYRMIGLIAYRCLPKYGGSYGIEADDIHSTTFERWIKYRHNFDPFRRSEVSGLRVNAFAYMTQMVKNTIFEYANKAKRAIELEERLKGDSYLYESMVQDFLNKNSEEALLNLDSEVVKLLVEKVVNHKSITTLIREIETLGYSFEEVSRVIGDFGLLEPLQEVLHRNRWAW